MPPHNPRITGGIKCSACERFGPDGRIYRCQTCGAAVCLRCMVAPCNEKPLKPCLYCQGLGVWSVLENRAVDCPVCKQGPATPTSSEVSHGN